MESCLHIKLDSSNKNSKLLLTAQMVNQLKLRETALLILRCSSLLLRILFRQGGSPAMPVFESAVQRPPPADSQLLLVLKIIMPMQQERGQGSCGAASMHSTLIIDQLSRLNMQNNANTSGQLAMRLNYQKKSISQWSFSLDLL
jgi:hypothetical protein